MRGRKLYILYSYINPRAALVLLCAREKWHHCCRFISIATDTLFIHGKSESCLLPFVPASPMNFEARHAQNVHQLWKQKNRLSLIVSLSYTTSKYLLYNINTINFWWIYSLFIAFVFQSVRMWKGNEECFPYEIVFTENDGKRNSNFDCTMSLLMAFTIHLVNAPAKCSILLTKVVN